MRISVDWLNEFVKLDLPVSDLVKLLAMIGLVVESVEEINNDIVLEIETYANRPDTLGHLGIAREISAFLGLPLVKKTWPIIEFEKRTEDLIGVEILEELLCPRYCGLVVKDVSVGPSPDWLRQRIEAMGLKPINNVVDVTNYVLFATGQPIHAFDFSKIEGSRILIRKAKKGEQLCDLEGRMLNLNPDMLVIADASKPVAIAGVIGGEASAITSSTTEVFIESACFDPVSIRMTAKKLGISTESSYRFERGTDISFPPEAARMVASLLAQMGGLVSSGLIDVYPRPSKVKQVTLRRPRVSALLGCEVESEFIEKTLTNLGFSLKSKSKESWLVEVPSFRVDIDREADLVEEIARFYGYDRIPSVVAPAKHFELPANKKREKIRRLKTILLNQGFDEVINFSFANPEFEKVIGSQLKAIELQNPISQKASFLRTTLLSGLLETVSWNLNRGLDGVYIFEAGNIYYQEEDVFKEEIRLALAATGLFSEGGWWGSPEEADFFKLKGAIEAMFEFLRYVPFEFEAAEQPAYERNVCLEVLYKGQPLGYLGMIRREIAAHFSIDQPVYAAELDLAGLLEKQPKPFQFAAVPKFPAITRDLSILIDKKISYQEVLAVLKKLNQPYLETIELQDRFSGAPIPADKVSMTFRFRYRNPLRTLQSEEVDKIERDIVAYLRAALNIQLREGKIDN